MWVSRVSSIVRSQNILYLFSELDDFIAIAKVSDRWYPLRAFADADLRFSDENRMQVNKYYLDKAGVQSQI
jgi:hypothetical protein